MHLQINVNFIFNKSMTEVYDYEEFAKTVSKYYKTLPLKKLAALPERKLEVAFIYREIKSGRDILRFGFGHLIRPYNDGSDVNLTGADDFTHLKVGNYAHADIFQALHVRYLRPSVRHIPLANSRIYIKWTTEELVDKYRKLKKRTKDRGHGSDSDSFASKTSLTSRSKRGSKCK